MENISHGPIKSNSSKSGKSKKPKYPPRHVEVFIVESWLEHLRQHERVTVADRDVETMARAFHVGDQPPIVSHFVSDYGDQERKMKTSE